jgi:hypothetical protein
MGLAKLIIRKGALGAESKDEVELLMRRCYDNSFTEVCRSDVNGGYFISMLQIYGLGVVYSDNLQQLYVSRKVL